VEAHLPGDERPPRQRYLRALDRKRGAPAAVGDAQALEGKRRAQAAPAAGNAANRDRGARGAFNRGDDLVAVGIDLGKRDVPEVEDEDGENDREEDRGAGGQAENDAR